MTLSDAGLSIAPGPRSDIYPKSEVFRSYFSWVVLPVVAAPLLGQSTVFVMDRLGQQGSGGGFGIGVMVVAWVVVLSGTIVLGRRFSEDRRRTAPNGATGWYAASIALVALPLLPTALLILVAIEFAIGANSWR